MTKRRRQRVTLAYPQHALSPEHLLHFIESTVFTKRWKELGLNEEEDLLALQLRIMVSPRTAPVIPGTGGLRKLRFVPPHAGIGKSGGYRICYVYFEEYGIVYLVYVYDKHEKDDLDPDERKTIRNHIRREKAALDRRKSI